MRFTNDQGTNLVALANWTRPPQPTSTRYPAGFTNLLNGFGTRYAFNQLTNDLAAMPSHAVTVGALPTPGSTNAVVWSPALRRMTNATGMTVTLNATTGLWDGIYPESTSRQRLPFKTTLQRFADHYVGTGYTIQSNISGTVVFSPGP